MHECSTPSTFHRVGLFEEVAWEDVLVGANGDFMFYLIPFSLWEPLVLFGGTLHVIERLMPPKKSCAACDFCNPGYLLSL